MRKTLLLCLLATPLAFNAAGQVSSSKAPALRAGQPVTLSWAQAVRAVHHTDSLRQTLGTRTLEAAAASKSAAIFRRSADSLKTALIGSWLEGAEWRDALATSNVLLASQTAKTEKYRKRAERKGWLNGLLLAVIGGLVYTQITH